MGTLPFLLHAHSAFATAAPVVATATAAPLIPGSPGYLLPPPFLGEGMLFALQHANWAGHFVLILLALGSIFSWSVMISKFLQIRTVRRRNQEFMKRFRASRTPLSLVMSGDTFPGSTYYEIYDAGARELVFQMTGSNNWDERTAAILARPPRVSAVAMASVRSAMERQVSEQALKLEDRMITLATAVSGAPFLGLLGTVWGVMDTFSDIAQKGNASLATMAPGVSGALITTVTGLLVAIPAMFGYNFLVVTVRRLTVEMDNFGAELAAACEHRYLGSASHGAERPVQSPAERHAH
ncbi:MAG TPA: MotA/TolQ/ExbB proton channel family protein, partial [Candidatus Methylacidiphilales bacterium]|nr:MotA/TolQ/ExbB proton channel family protein [Candidatus Methylacidiphilales bacterium]